MEVKLQNLKDKEIEKLKLVLLPCREPIPEEARAAYNSAYRLWHSVWSETLKELDGVEKLFSNEFTRHDFFAAIFKGEDAISLTCYSGIDLKLDARKNDAWFESWPQDFLQKETEREAEILIGAWYCVAPEYRKSRLDFPFNVAKVMMETFGKVILDEGYSVGYGTSRNNRGVNKLLYDIGAIKYGESFAHGCTVDLVLVEPENVRKVQLSYSNIFKKLWENRIDYRKEKYEQKLPKAA